MELAVAGFRAFCIDGRAASEPDFCIAMLTAGVSLVLRRLDNIHKGLTKEPFDRAARRLADRFLRTAATADARTESSSPTPPSSK